MAIPDFETVMRPLLVHLEDGREYQTRETLDALAAVFSLTPEDRQELLPSGKQPLFTNRVAWAKFYLKKAGAVENPRRGIYRITALGRQLLKENPDRVDESVLLRIPAFRDFRLNSRSAEAELIGAGSESAGRRAPPAPQPTHTGAPAELSPEELLELGHSRLHGQLAAELLEVVKQSSPEFFEQLVVDLLLALGYGGSRADAGRTVGKSGDGGIDGIINEDRLGLDVIYIQAKRWEGVVGRPEIQKFAGALQGQRARKGIFITTSEFTREALDYVRAIDSKIVLLDGKQLARLMIQNNVGVSRESVYEVKRIDSDYFAES
jgi:restriction system protein